MTDYIYIHHYDKGYSNRLLVVGFLRSWFKFKLFLYIKLKK